MASDVLGVTVKVGEQMEIGSLSVFPLIAVAGRVRLPDVPGIRGRSDRGE